MTEKIYEPINPQDLKDFALLCSSGSPRSRAAKIFLIQAVSFALIVDGPIEASVIANCSEKSKPSKDDSRWDWHLTEAESLEMIRLLLDSIAD